MRTRSAFVAGLALGLVAGSLAVLLLDLKTRPVFRSVLRSNFMIELERNAALATNAGDAIRTAANRWCAVEVATPDATSVFADGFRAELDGDLLSPFALLILGQVEKPSRVTAPLVEETLARAKLALALEAVGQQPSANEQWHIVERLAPDRSNEQLRRIALDTAEQERKVYAQVVAARP